MIAAAIAGVAVVATLVRKYVGAGTELRHQMKWIVFAAPVLAVFSTLMSLVDAPFTGFSTMVSLWLVALAARCGDHKASPVRDRRDHQPGRRVRGARSLHRSRLCGDCRGCRFGGRRLQPRVVDCRHSRGRHRVRADPQSSSAMGQPPGLRESCHTVRGPVRSDGPARRGRERGSTARPYGRAAG